MDLNEQRLALRPRADGRDGDDPRRRRLDDDVKAFTELTGGKLGNVVVDATGSAKSMVDGDATSSASPGGWCGSASRTDELTFTQPLMHRREMTLLASRNALPHEFTRIIRLIEDGMIDTRPWITHRAPFEAMIGEFPSG